jgi:monoamine oxidase
MEPYDVIIVGAGLTGLVAADTLAHAGKKVLVLEARDRVGGRTYSVTETRNGITGTFDFGAHFVGNEPYQKPVIDLINTLNLDLFEQYEGPEQSMPTPEEFWAGLGANLLWVDKTITAYIGTTIPPEPASLAALSYLLGIADSVRLDSVDLTPNAEILDQMSVWDWVTTYDLPDWGPLPDTFKSQVRMLCRVGFSCEPEDISMLWFLFYLKSNGGLVRFQSIRWPVQGAQGYRLKKGAQSIALALADRINAMQPGAIMTSAPVNAITQFPNEEHASVIAGGKMYYGRQVLVALAPRLMQNIKFVPPLPPTRAFAATTMQNSTMIMAYVTFDKAFWRSDTTTYTTGTANGLPFDDISKYGLSGDVLLADWPVSWIMDNSSAEGIPALMAFIVGKEAEDLRKGTFQDREQIVIDTISQCFGPDAVKANNPVYREMDWTGETYSEGCPAGHFPPKTFLPALSGLLLRTPGAGPAGRVHFASTETASIANGYMSGAVWSGQEVAADIMQALDSPIEWSRDTFLREIAMRDAVKVIMQAISFQNPMMEWPALDEHCDFTGPGGKALPADHYIGQEGTVAFYARLGFFITITRLNVDCISVDAASNMAYAEFTVDGVANSTQLPFYGVKARMVFEFTDPAQPAALIARDWLLMDTDEIDRIIFDTNANPATLPRLAADAEKLANDISTALRTGTPVTDPRCARTVITGPGGTGFAKGPYFGPDGFAQVSALIRRPNFMTQWMLQSTLTDITTRSTVMTWTVQGQAVGSGQIFKQPLLMVFRFSNDEDLLLDSLSIVTDSTTLA